MTSVAALAEALDRGGRVVWDREPPRLLVPSALRLKVEADRATVREVLRRAAIFREQVRTPGPCPILALPDCPDGDGCLSCDATIDPGHFRCELCALAVRLALEGVR